MMTDPRDHNGMICVIMMERGPHFSHLAASARSAAWCRCPRAPPDPPDGRGADPPREWSYELLFDDFPVPDPVLA